MLLSWCSKPSPICHWPTFKILMSQQIPSGTSFIYHTASLIPTSKSLSTPEAGPQTTQDPSQTFRPHGFSFLLLMAPCNSHDIIIIHSTIPLAANAEERDDLKLLDPLGKKIHRINSVLPLRCPQKCWLDFDIMQSSFLSFPSPLNLLMSTSCQIFTVFILPGSVVTEESGCCRNLEMIGMHVH